MSNPFNVGDLVSIHNLELRTFVGNADPVTVSEIINEHQVAIAEDIRTNDFPKIWNITHLTFRRKAVPNWIEDTFYDETPEIAEIRAAFINGEKLNVGS